MEGGPIPSTAQIVISVLSPRWVGAQRPFLTSGLRRGQVK